MGNLNLEFIKKRRQELNLSLQEMAESLGFKNASTYMKYEDGTYSFKANHLPILANKLEAKIEDFFIENFAEIAILENEVSKEVI
ncbi:transcriptional regulator [Paenibacillus odorifer]|uniref:helix-turn-helix domain-containing protein n=1 Tax=Paenibacillus odorifer TaxID=189426 RepID=UPI00096C8B0D|nr:helix-turn-helix transcriptional regulator [Paenibacillus odorifer]OMC76491.1 transcriptional regulator [Paenibacillus odorifer]